jgi:hypothetical protein
MSMTYHDQVFLAPLSRRKKARGKKAEEPQDDHGIGRSPRFAPGWWLAGVAIFYAAIALICIFVL